jgi:hypothetical protein
MMLVATAITACGASSPPGSVAAKNYDRKCASVADCIPVYEGHVGCCGGGDCPNTAIAQVALSKYTMDLSLAASCGGGRPPCPHIGGTSPGGNACQDGRVACDNGICILAMPPSDAAQDE